MLTAIFMLSAISMTTAAVFFMSFTVAAFRYENGKTTAEHDQQEPDYHKSNCIPHRIVILRLFFSRCLGFLMIDAEVLPEILD